VDTKKRIKGFMFFARFAAKEVPTAAGISFFASNFLGSNFSQN